MAKIIYILGAGASSKALPVVSEMAEFLTLFLAHWGRSAESENYIRTMINESSLYPSPDVYARTLFLRGDKRFLHFNNLLSLAFFWKQKVRGLGERFKSEALRGMFKYNVDPRYLAFFSTLIDNPESGKLPQNLGFILWNYDLQIEESMKMLKINNIPQIIRLNGIANVEYNGNMLDSVEELNVYKDNFLNLKSQIRYGWDDQLENKSGLEPILFDTEKIIVVGYSFPVYNRFTDTQIFQFLRRGFKEKPPVIIELVGRDEKTLEKIESSLRQILNHFNWSHDGMNKTPKIERKVSPEQFPIPYELPIFGRV